MRGDTNSVRSGAAALIISGRFEGGTIFRVPSPPKTMGRVRGKNANWRRADRSCVGTAHLFTQKKQN